MEPEFHQEDFIVINPYLKAEHNDYVFVCNEEWEATFKQLKNMENQGAASTECEI